MGSWDQWSVSVGRIQFASTATKSDSTATKSKMAPKKLLYRLNLMLGLGIRLAGWLRLGLKKRL